MTPYRSLLLAGLALVLGVALWLVLRTPGEIGGVAMGSATTGPPPDGARAEADLVAPGATEVAVPATAARTEVASTTGRAPAAQAAVAQPDSQHASLTVHVRRGRGGPPVPGETVRLRAGGIGFVARHAREIDRVTDASGMVKFEDLAPGAFGVQALRGTPRTVRLAPGANEVVELTIAAGVTVAGEVVDPNGAPVPGAELLFCERWNPSRVAHAGIADGAGRFALEDVGPDTFVSARAPGFVASRQVVPRGAPGDRLEVVLRLGARGVAISGIVLDARGVACPAAIVLVGDDPAGWHETGGFAAAAPAPERIECDAEGRFQTRAAPVGEILVRAAAAGHALLEQRVTVGAAGAAGIVLQLVPEASVRGVVTDLRGEPVPRTLVATGFSFDSQRTYTDASGSFVLDGLAPGEYALDARHDERGRATARLVLRAGERATWDPVLAPSPTIHGRVLDERGAGAPGYAVAAFDAATGTTHHTQSERDGGFRIPNLEPHPYRVTVHEPDGLGGFPLLLVDAVVPSAEALELRLGGADTGRVLATILGPDGTPVVGARLTIGHPALELWREATADAETGQVLVPAVPAGVIVLGLYAPGSGGRHLGERTLEAGGTLDLGELRLAPVGAVELTLTGLDLAAATQCHLVLVPVTGEAQGRHVEVEGLVVHAEALPVGRWRATLRGRRVVQEPIELTVEKGLTTRAHMPVVLGGEHTVRILDVAENAVPSCWLVDAAGRTVWESGSLVRDAPGTYLAHPTARPGQYTFLVFLSPQGRVERALTFTGASDHGETTLSAAQ